MTIRSEPHTSVEGGIMTGPGESSIGTERKLQDEAQQQITNWSLDLELARGVPTGRGQHPTGE